MELRLHATSIADSTMPWVIIGRPQLDMEGPWLYVIVPSEPNTRVGLLGKFPPFCYFPIFFQNYETTGYLVNISFIFDRCHRSLAALTPVKYEFDSTDMPGWHAKV